MRKGQDSDEKYGPGRHGPVLRASVIHSAGGVPVQIRRRRVFCCIGSGNHDAGRDDSIDRGPAPTTAPAAPEAGTGYCSVESLIVRGGPGTDYYGIGGLKFGEQVEILSREGDWFRIAFQPGPDGVGYVSAQYIQGAPPAPTTAPMTTASTEPVPTE